MNARISARELFEQLGERLSLRWVAGESGGERVLEAVETVARRLRSKHPTTASKGSSGLFV